MASMNISIKKEAYDFLKSMKSKEESFSDVILSFRDRSSDILQFFGKLKDTDWDKMEKEMKGLRDSFEKRLK
jgi:predicted CopG family antitoxin